MKRASSCETFRKADRNTYPALPSIPEQQFSETSLLLAEQLIDDILRDFLTPIPKRPIKNDEFLKSFLQQVDNHTTELLNDRFLK